ncbi:MAG TPA: YraN family protein [bacterium]|nr:YraN family protein [bacterium]
MAMKKKPSTHSQGKRAEETAALFLKLKGYRVLEANYRVPQGEIDLIASRGGALVFVEVKSRNGKTQGTPLEAVTPRKVKRLTAAASIYLSNRPEEERECRFDVVTLGPDKNLLGLPKIRHFENAFSPEGFFNV